MREKQDVLFVVMLQFYYFGFVKFKILLDDEMADEQDSEMPEPSPVTITKQRFYSIKRFVKNKNKNVKNVCQHLFCN